MEWQSHFTLLEMVIILSIIVTWCENWAFDPVALDCACADMVKAAPSLRGNAISDKDAAHEHGEDCGFHHHHKGDDKFRIVHPDTNWEAGVEYGELIGLGSRTYELIKVR